MSEYIIPGIHENDIRQGFIGDCYFLVCLMALANNEKTFIQNHLDITHNQQGFPESFNVKLYNKDGQIPDPNNPKIKIPISDFLTHGVAQVDITGDYDNENRIEVWPKMYEKAWAYIRTDTKKFGAIDGGNAAAVWPFLTGKKVPKDNQIYYEVTQKKEDNNEIKADIERLKMNAYLVISTYDKGKMTFNEKNYKYPSQADNNNNNNDYYTFGPPVEDHVYLFDSINANKVIMLNPHGRNHVELDINDLSGVIDALIALPKP